MEKRNVTKNEEQEIILEDFIVKEKIQETYYRNDSDELTIGSMIDKILYIYPEAEVNVKSSNEIVVNREGDIFPKFKDIEGSHGIYVALAKMLKKTMVQKEYELKRNAPITMSELLKLILEDSPKAEFNVIDDRHLIVNRTYGK